MKEKFPTHIIISDIGSGLNYKRKGLQEIMKKAINGETEELVIAYKDRLTRFGYELIEDLIKEYSNGKIIIINKDKELKDVVNDVLFKHQELEKRRKNSNESGEDIFATPKSTPPRKKSNKSLSDGWV